MSRVDKDGCAYRLDLKPDNWSHTEEKKGRFFSLSIGSGKGGVGKTLTIVNLAMAVSHMGLKVLILDGDFGLANVDVVLGLQGQYHVQDVLAGFVSLDEIILQGPNGISLIPSGSGVSELNHLSYTQKQMLFQKILHLGMEFDFLLIDTGAGINENVLHLNSISDSRLIVTTPEPHAITDAYALIKVLAEKEGVIKLNDLGNELTVQHVFELVLRLKQICNADPLTGDSSKMEKLEADLEEVAASGHKAIVFSQWVNTIEKVADRLERFNPLQYHGKIPSAKRDGILDEFKESKDRPVILMSYGTGSVGLNLQFCRYVFLFDRWWNPAVEDQAINRAHRLGSAGSVTVNRMICVSTIEERIHDVLEEKRDLFNSVLGEKGNIPMGLNQKDIFGLFRLEMPSKKTA